MKRAAALAILALAACEPTVAPIPQKEQLVGAANPSGRFLLMVLDVSMSMQSNDPMRFNEQGAHLAVSLAGSEDNFGAITFSSQASLASRLRQVRDPKGRRELHADVTNLPRNGQTNYVDALRWAKGIFEAARAPEGSAVVFLTDGEHNVGGSEADVLAAANGIREKGWNIFTIGLAEGADSALLRRVAVATRGAHFPVIKAEDLVTAFLAILGQVHNFMFFEGQPKPIRLFPGTNRLVYVGIKEASSARIAGLTRDGAPLLPEAPGYSKYPEFADSRAQIETASVEKPEAGVWDARLEGAMRIGAILQQPSFNVRLDERTLRREYYEGEKIDVALLVDGGGREVLEHVRANGKASVSIRPEGSEADLDTVQLTAEPGGGDAVRFRGSLTAKASTAGKPELQTLLAKFTLSEKEGGVWRRDVRVSFMAQPGKRPMGLTVAPAELDFGSVWSDSGPASRDVTMTAAAAGMQAKARGLSPFVKVSPESAAPAATGTALKVTVDPAAVPPGDFESAVEISGTRSESIDPEMYTVKVKMRVARLAGAPGGDGTISLGEHAQGERIEVPLALGVEGGQGSVTATGLSGAGNIDTAIDGGKYKTTVPANAKSGDYTGSVTLKAPGFPDRTFPVKLKVAAAVARFKVEPAEVSFVADKPGEYKADLKITMSFPRDADVTIGETDLKGQDGSIKSAFVSLINNKDDWDRKKLPAGKEVRATVEVRIKSDHRNGDYAGKISVTAAGDDGQPAGRVEIPVKIKVKLQ